MQNLTPYYRLVSSDGVSYVPVGSVADTVSISQYKIMMTRAMSGSCIPGKDGSFKVISRVEVIEPSVVCTDSYIIICPSDNKTEPENCLKYLKTRFLRFLVLQSVSSINLTREKFQFVPLQDFTPSSDIAWGGSVGDIDSQLYDKYGLSSEERAFIETTIRPME